MLVRLSLPLISLYLWILCIVSVAKAQMITQPPESTTAALDTNATFSCRGIGKVLWEINGTQVRDASQVPVFANVRVFVPLPRDNFSELTVTATRDTNATLVIICTVDPFIGVGDPDRSEPVRLLVYDEPNPPPSINVQQNGMNLVATWSEPFSLEGEELSYVVSIMNTVTGVKRNVTINITSYVLSEPIGERDCAEYLFTVFSKNGFSKSQNGITGRNNIPTKPLILRASDVRIDVSLASGISATIHFNSTDPCPSYPVINYTFSVTERATNTLIAANSQSLPPVTLNSGLVANQAYELIIEAENDVGRTVSEIIPFYTTGLLSATAVVEFNGSITVTCTFATGASSTGCQVTIFPSDSLQEVFSTNISRPNRATQVFERLSFQGDYTLLYIQTVELLGGGGVGNVVFNSTVSLTGISFTTARTSFPVTTLSSERSQVPVPGALQYIIIGVVIAVFVLVLVVLIVITGCILISLQRRRKSQDISTQDAGGNRYESSIYPTYETITERVGVSGDTIQTLHNPVYNGIVVHSGSDIQVATYPVYAEIGQMGSNLNNRRNHTINVLSSRAAAPLSPSSETGSFVSQVPSPYLEPQRSPGAARAKSDNQVHNPSPYTKPVPHRSDNENTSYACINREGLCTRNTGLTSGDREGAVSSNLSRMDEVQHTERPPIYESIKAKDIEHPLVRKDSGRDQVRVHCHQSNSPAQSESYVTLNS